MEMTVDDEESIVYFQSVMFLVVPNVPMPRHALIAPMNIILMTTRVPVRIRHFHYTQETYP